jgi:hypothetical protein
MGARVEITYEFVQRAAQSAPVRRALAAKARRVQQRAEGLAQGEGVTLDSRVTEGTRPRGRPYARVESDNVSQEWGSSNTERRRILGRAAEGA